VTRRLWHSCGRYKLADHFAGKAQGLCQVFDDFVKLARECGPVTVYAQKTRIVIQARVRFASVVVRKNWLDAGMWLKPQIERPRLVRVEDSGRLDFGHHFRLAKREDIDDGMAALMREAHRIGEQEHIYGRSKVW